MFEVVQDYERISKERELNGKGERCDKGREQEGSRRVVSMIYSRGQNKFASIDSQYSHGSNFFSNYRLLYSNN